MSGAGYCDIRFVTVKQDGDTLVLTIFLAQDAPTTPDHHIAYMWSIDLDKNPETGWTDPILRGDLGVDVQPVVRKNSNFNIWEAKFQDYTQYPPSIPFEVSGRKITMIVDLSLLDNPSSFNFLVRTYDENYDSFDLAPNAGHESWGRK